MEAKLREGGDFYEIIREGLDVPKISGDDFSSLNLAYIGDDVYDLVIRTYLLKEGNLPVNAVNRMANALVKAGAQSRMMETLEPLLSEEELAVYRRGRNAKSHTKAKNATIIDYRRATGLEALMGYLYLQRRYERIVQLIAAGIKNLEKVGR